MTSQTTLDKSALFDATEAYWDAGVTDKGIEAAITAYLDRMGLAAIHSLAVGARQELLARLEEGNAYAHMVRARQ